MRQAKNKKDLDKSDYQQIKKEIFEKGKDAREVKKDLTALIRQRKELDPEEAHAAKRLSVLKRFLGGLKAVKRELETSKFGSSALIKDAESLIKKIEAEINL